MASPATPPPSPCGASWDSGYRVEPSGRPLGSSPVHQHYMSSYILSILALGPSKHSVFRLAMPCPRFICQSNTHASADLAVYLAGRSAALAPLSQGSDRLLTPAVAETSLRVLWTQALGTPLCTLLQRWNHPGSGAAAVAHQQLIVPSTWLLQKFAPLHWVPAQCAKGPLS